MKKKIVSLTALTKDRKRRILDRLHCPLVIKPVRGRVTNEKAVISFFFYPFLFLSHHSEKWYKWFNKKSNLFLLYQNKFFYLTDCFLIIILQHQNNI